MGLLGILISYTQTLPSSKPIHNRDGYRGWKSRDFA